MDVLQFFYNVFILSILFLLYYPSVQHFERHLMSFNCAIKMTWLDNRETRKRCPLVILFSSITRVFLFFWFLPRLEPCATWRAVWALEKQECGFYRRYPVKTFGREIKVLFLYLIPRWFCGKKDTIVSTFVQRFVASFSVMRSPYFPRTHLQIRNRSDMFVHIF